MRLVTVFRVLGLLVFGAAVRPAPGQTPGLPQRVTLRQVLSLLADRSPRTAAERARLDIVAADRITASALPNPSFSYGSVRLASGANTGAALQQQIGIDQPLPLFGVRGARTSLAALNTAAERARVAADLARTRAEVRQVFVALLARQEESTILQASVAEMQRAEGVIRGRADAGERSQYDVLRIATERRALEVEAMNAAADVHDTAGRLAALLGVTGWSPEAEGSLAPGDISTDAPTLWTLAQARRPRLLVERQQLVAARAGLTLARRERLPAPSLSGGAVFTRNERSTSAFVGLSLPLPVFDQNRGAIAKAFAELRAESLALDAETAEAQADIERARATLVARREALAAVERDIMERVPMLRRMAEDSYREGRGDILALLDALRSLKDFELLHVRQMERAKLAEEDLIASVGSGDG